MVKSFKIFLIIIAFSLGVHLTASESQLTGKWKCGSSVIEFSKSKTHLLKLKGILYQFTISGNDFVIKDDPKKTKYAFKMVNDNLQVYYPQEAFIYKRK